MIEPKVLPNDHSIALASNAADIIETAIISDDLDNEIADATLAIALTARRREFNQTLKTPKEILPEVFEEIQSGHKIAFVFGAEKTGLTINQLEKCNRLVTIPGNPEYFSLNLAQAVQIICYEIYASYNPDISYLKNNLNLASINDNIGILNHLYQILDKINYNYKNINVTKRRLQNIIHKSSLEREEVDLLRGILKKIETI